MLSFLYVFLCLSKYERLNLFLWFERGQKSPNLSKKKPWKRALVPSDFLFLALCDSSTSEALEIGCCCKLACSCFLSLHGMAELHGHPGDGGTFVSALWLRKSWLIECRAWRKTITFPWVWRLDDSWMEKLFYSFLALRYTVPSYFDYPSLKINFPLCFASEVSYALLVVIQMRAETPQLEHRGGTSAESLYVALISAQLVADQGCRGRGSGQWAVGLWQTWERLYLGEKWKAVGRIMQTSFIWG